MSSPSQIIEQQSQRIEKLEEEIRTLRDQLDRIEQNRAAVDEARVRLMSGGMRLLLPLFDRQRVVRSFAKLAETSSEFANPTHRWPAKEQVLVDARDFLESCVRFVIRRRTLLLVFSLTAALIPALQIWLVVKQNQIIENQNEFITLQVYDSVSRALAEEDRNVAQATGALMARANPDFLSGVIEEVFDPVAFAASFSEDDANAATRRFEDAAFRGPLIRAVSRNIKHRAQQPDVDTEILYQQTRRMAQQILRDSEDRMIQVLRLGRAKGNIDGELVEKVNQYFVYVGDLLRIYGRLARTMEQEEAFFADIKPLFARLAGRRDIAQSRFAGVYRIAIEEFLFDLAMAPALGAPRADLEAGGKSPDEALRLGIDRLRQGLGDKAVNWTIFEEQMEAR